jgi:ABC-2 type transport system ATP-binding protein
MDHGKVLETGSVEELAKVVGDGHVVTISGPFTAGQFRTALEREKVSILSAAENSGAVSLKPDQMNVVVLLQKLGAGGVEVTDVSIQKPSLESVFLKLTGRELRD